MFIANENRVTEMVVPVRSFVTRRDPHAEFAVMVQNKVFYLLGHMVPFALSGLPEDLGGHTCVLYAAWDICYASFLYESVNVVVQQQDGKPLGHNAEKKRPLHVSREITQN